jgi:hypothetical protein
VLSIDPHGGRLDIEIDYAVRATNSRYKPGISVLPVGQQRDRARCRAGAGMDIVESLIVRPGQSREERLAEELGPHFADVEERRARALYEFVRSLAATCATSASTRRAISRSGEWQPFFSASLPGTRAGDAAPHLALLGRDLQALSYSALRDETG